jgi:PST family polysaccharide transporter
MSLDGDARRSTSRGALGRGGLHRSSLGALAGSGASALRLLCQLGLLPILARLIGPEEYGLVALAMPVILLANVVTDGGLVLALGRQREVSRTVESTVFWITVGVGLTLALSACAVAFPIGELLRQPRLPWLILALSPILLMNSLTSVSNGRIIRERRFATFAAGDVISTLAGAATALAAATHGWGAWSLVAQQLVLWVFKLTWVTARGGARIGFTFRFQAVRDLVTFGANNIGGTIADFAAKNVDNMIIGGVLGATALGHYAMAYQVIRVPDMLISGPFYFYILTALARAAHRGDRDAIHTLAKAGLRIGAVALAAPFCGLALVADLVVGLILGPKWTGSIAPLRFLAAAGFCFCMCSIMAAMMMGLGKAALQLRLSIVLGLSTVVSVGIGAAFGLAAVSGALSFGVALVGFYYVDQLARDLGVSRVSLLASLIPAAQGTLVMALAVLLTRELLAGAPPLLALAACVVAGAASYGAVIWLVARRRLMMDASAFGQAHADARNEEAADPAHAEPASVGASAE